MDEHHQMLMDRVELGRNLEGFWHAPRDGMFKVATDMTAPIDARTVNGQSNGRPKTQVISMAGSAL